MAYLLAAMLGLMGCGAAVTATPRHSVARRAESVSTLRVGLYPWVPRLAQFQSAVQATWAERHPDVALNFVTDWDGGYDHDPTDYPMDVFVFDAVFLDYFNAQGWLLPLQADEVDNASDFFPYAINGVRSGDGYSAIPLLGCTQVLFFHTDDAPVAAIRTLSDMNALFGQCTYTSQVPPDQRGLMLDLSGGTTNACYYVNAVEAISGQWPVPLPPTPDGLNQQAVQSLRTLLALSSYYNATGDTPGPYDRSAWFSNGYGRAVIGYTESLSAMTPETRAGVSFMVAPAGDDPTAPALFYSDVIGINPQTPNAALAVEFANLLASSDVVVASTGPTQSDGAQYLLPTRPSVLATLGEDDPLYLRMSQMVNTANPQLFNLGPSARSWIESMKSAIRTAVRAEYPCGCDQNAGPIMDQAQASQQCPVTCGPFGGWNGQWRTVDDGSSVCGCNVCPAP